MGVEVHKGEEGKGMGRGNTAAIVHTGAAAGLMTRYGHMEEVHVTGGETVERGQVIGTVGTSGCNPEHVRCDPHLRFEVWAGAKPVRPQSKIAGCDGREGTEPDKAKPLVYPLRC